MASPLTRLRATVFVLVASLAPIIPATAAPLAAASGDEVRVPAEYVRAKLAFRRAKPPTGKYRVMVDVSPGKEGLARVAQSSGNHDVDEVAMDFADAYVTQIPRLREMHLTRELRFPLLFDLQPTTGVWHTSLPKGAVGAHTTLQVGGLVMIRVATGPDGRISQAKVIKSSGLERFDDALADYARRHWSGPPNSATIVPSFAIPGPR